VTRAIPPGALARKSEATSATCPFDPSFDRDNVSSVWSMDPWFGVYKRMRSDLVERKFIAATIVELRGAR
jgi:hypothetical protein